MQPAEVRTKDEPAGLWPRNPPTQTYPHYLAGVDHKRRRKPLSKAHDRSSWITHIAFDTISYWRVDAGGAGVGEVAANFVVNQALTNHAGAFTVFANITQEMSMIFSRWLMLFAMLFSLGWSGSGQAATKLTSASLAGNWSNAKGKTLTFMANGTINYQGKRYYYAVSNGGIIQLKGRHGEKTIPYQLSSGKLTLTEGGVATIYRRKR